MAERRRVAGIVVNLLAAAVASGCSDFSGPSPITVTAVSPATGLLTGGTSVTITGTNFVDITSATIGGNEVGNRTIVTTTEITGTAPAAIALGATDVVVTSTSHGRGVCSGCFNYEWATGGGREIAFFSQRGGTYQIDGMDADGSGRRNIAGTAATGC